ncbi:hypothetical protein LXA43DRAFT_1028383 [Ganoderma leucocontextum]|nr:hypothetical protein LXA43DRAFT_1028383 [Ganoderma leucocontextum]
MSTLHALSPSLQDLLDKSTALVHSGGPMIVDQDTFQEMERNAIMFISNIRQCYNSSATLSVNRLPPEVLQIVFHYLIAPTSLPPWSVYETRNEATSYKPLTGAMLVCRRWRSIAMQTALLWTEIDLSVRPSLASYFLERSRAAPIRLRSNIEESENRLVKSVMQHHGDRIFKLEFWGPASAQLEAHASLDVAMPNLRQLNLVFEPQGGLQVTCAYHASPEHVPALRALVLSGTLWIPTGIVPTLTHINVKYMTDVDVSLLWNLLCNTPMLEVFELSSNVGLTVAHGPAPASSLTLPCLQDLVIDGAHTDVVHYLVSHLELPNVTVVSYRYLFAESGTLLERLLPSSLATHTPTRVTLVIGGDYHVLSASFQGDGTSVTLQELVASSYDDPPLQERMQWPFATFPTLLSLANVTEFHLSSSMWEPDSLRRLGAHLGNVTTLCLATHADGPFDVAMTMELGVALSSALLADDPVVLPRLASLDIDTIDVPRNFIGVLSRALAKRDRDGRRLRYLCVHVGALWPAGRLRDAHDDLKATGLFDHVDGGYSMRSDYSSSRWNWDSEVRHTPRTPAHGYW